MSDPGLPSEVSMAGRYTGGMPEASWLRGEVRRHCARCEAEVDWLQRTCSKCGARLRKECSRCHYWVELDATFCVSCRHGFPLPPPPRPTVRLWHDSAEERSERN